MNPGALRIIIYSGVMLDNLDAAVTLYAAPCTIAGREGRSGIASPANRATVGLKYELPR